MIELIYNEEESSTIEEKALPEPKNVKQVGEPREYKKIFLEDYVHTFLKQYSAKEKICLAILLGNSERSGGRRHLYIKSALPVEGVTEKQGKYQFTEKVWGVIYQECERYFPEQEILGWFLSKPGFHVEKTAVTEETHRTYFSGADKLLFFVEPIEGDSAFFGFDGNRFAKQSGYYIYYEKNEPMREYLLAKNQLEKQTSKNEQPDIVMSNFRKLLKEKQQENEKRKKQAVSYGTTLAVALALFLGIVVWKNQEDFSLDLTPVMNEVNEKEPVREAASDEVVVEELLGNVEEQQASEVQPEELPVTEEPEEEVTEHPEAQPEDNEEPEAESAEEAAAEVPVYQEYVVQPGDSLAKISRDFYGTDEWVKEICELNEISNGDYIQVGEIILLP